MLCPWHCRSEVEDKPFGPHSIKVKQNYAEEQHCQIPGKFGESETCADIRKLSAIVAGESGLAQGAAQSLSQESETQRPLYYTGQAP